jgi:methylated-DNA-[protein]-cysteine S-methyltransferase
VTAVLQYVAEYASPVGTLTLASDGESVTGIWIAGQKYFAATLGEHTSRETPPVLTLAAAWLDRYFRRGNPEMTLPLAPAGSAFRAAVWAVLLAVPYGGVTTYGEIARRLEETAGMKTSARAVGGAVGHNPVSIVIPCHRVVGADGGLTGYAGGLSVKRRLLELEGGGDR